MTQHDSKCRVKNGTARRKILRMPDPTKHHNPFLSRNKSTTRREHNATFAFGDVPTTNGDDIDDPCITTSETRAGILPTTSASRRTSMADDESIDVQCVIRGLPRRGMFSTTSAIRTQTYEEETGRKAGACVPPDDEIKDTHDDDEAAVGPYYPFNNSADYGLALWFERIGCTKRDVDRFFKNELLEPFRIGIQLQKRFRSGLSFKSGKEWLRQLDRIPTDVDDDDEQALEQGKM